MGDQNNALDRTGLIAKVVADYGDSDNNGLPNLVEDPVLNDSDQDGTPDAEDDDIDGDGLSNQDELYYGMNPYNANDALEDANGNGISNKEDILSGADPFLMPVLKIENTSVMEGESLSYTITLTNPVTGQPTSSTLPVSVAYQTSGGNTIALADASDFMDWFITKANAVQVDPNIIYKQGVAQPGVDYEAVKGQLFFAPGESTKTIVIKTFGDKIKNEGEAPTQTDAENFLINFLRPQNATLSQPRAVITITTPVADISKTTFSWDTNKIPAEPGEKAVVTIQLFDANGNPIKTGGDQVVPYINQEVSLYDGFSGTTQGWLIDDNTLDPVIVDNGDGSYTATYQIGASLAQTEVLAGTLTKQIYLASDATNRVNLPALTVSGRRPQLSDGSFSINENLPAASSVATLTATDPDALPSPLTYQLVNTADAAFFSIDANTGELKTTASLDYESQSQYQLVVAVSDGEFIKQANITVNLNNLNDNSPVINDQQAVITEDSALSTLLYQVLASDADGDTLSYSISAGNAGGYFAIDSASGQISLAKSLQGINNDYFDLTVNVSDSVNSNSAIVRLDLSRNHQPTIDFGFNLSAGQNNIKEGEYVSYYFNANDFEGKSNLTYSVKNLPAWASFDPTSGHLYGTPMDNDATHYTDSTPTGEDTGLLDRADRRINKITVTVTDQGVPARSAVLPMFWFFVEDVNNKPVFENAPATSVDEQVAYRYQPVISDLDSRDGKTFSINNKPEWASFDTTSGVLSGTPTQKDVGTYKDIKITVTDSPAQTLFTQPVSPYAVPARKEASIVFDLTVNNVNNRPEITGNPPQRIGANTPFQFNFKGKDADKLDTLTYSATNLPPFLRLNPETGTVSGTPYIEDVGNYNNITIIVQDDSGASNNTASVLFNLEVIGYDVSLDSDRDNILDYDERDFYGTSPIRADTDGDGFSDFQEIVDFGYDQDNNNFRFNPLIPDSPSVQLQFASLPDITLRYKTSQNQTVTISNKESNASFSSRTTSRVDSRGRSIEETSKLHVNGAVAGGGGSAGAGMDTGIPMGRVGPSASGFAGAGYAYVDYTKTKKTVNSYYMSLSNSQTAGNQQAYEKGVEQSQQKGIVTEGGELKIAVDLVNNSHIAFRVDQLVLTAVEPTLKVKDDALVIPIGNLTVDNVNSFPKATLGPGDRISNLVFSKTDLTYDVAQRLLRDLRNLTLEPAIIEMTDKNNVSFAHRKTAILANTAEVIIDYGPGNIEDYRVVTNAKGSGGISMADVMNNILLIDYQTGKDYLYDADNPSAPKPSAKGLIQVRNTRQDWQTEGKWLVIHYHDDGINPQAKLYDPADFPADSAGYDFDAIRLFAGDTLHMVYVSDADHDGIGARDEAVMNLSGDFTTDSDNDTISDYDELIAGKVIQVQYTDVGAPEQITVHADPKRVDSDSDGLPDAYEWNTSLTDPENPDTDGDYLPDDIDSAPTVFNKTDIDSLTSQVTARNDGSNNYDITLTWSGGALPTGVKNYGIVILEQVLENYATSLNDFDALALKPKDGVNYAVDQTLPCANSQVDCYRVVYADAVNNGLNTRNGSLVLSSGLKQYAKNRYLVYISINGKYYRSNEVLDVSDNVQYTRISWRLNKLNLGVCNDMDTPVLWWWNAFTTSPVAYSNCELYWHAAYDGKTVAHKGKNRPWRASTWDHYYNRQVNPDAINYTIGRQVDFLAANIPGQCYQLKATINEGEYNYYGDESSGDYFNTEVCFVDPDNDGTYNWKWRSLAWANNQWQDTFDVRTLGGNVSATDGLSWSDYKNISHIPGQETSVRIQTFLRIDNP